MFVRLLVCLVYVAGRFVLLWPSKGFWAHQEAIAIEMVCVVAVIPEPSNIWLKRTSTCPRWEGPSVGASSGRRGKG